MKKVTLTHQETKKEILLPGVKMTIGRDTSCDFQVPRVYGDVSRVHCTIIEKGEKIVLQDSSKNGTWISKKKKLKRGETVEISNGQEIVLGDRYSVKIEFVDEDDNDIAILDAVEDELSDTALGLKP